MRHEVEKRIREYDEDVVVLSQDEAEMFAYLLRKIMKFSEVDGKFRWFQSDVNEVVDADFAFRARIYKSKGITPEALTDMRLSVTINGITLVNDYVKIDKC